MKCCSIGNCGGKVLARGWCGKHYQRWTLHGDVNVDLPKSYDERFWRRVEKTESCWRWTGAVAGRYGQCRSGPNQKIPAHRFSWLIHFGAISDGLFVCHTCDNPLCVRPDHLFLGDASDNMRDMVQKGRHPKQLRSYRKKLTENDVLAIRASSLGNTVLARQYKVDHSTILGAKKRRSWRHI